MRSLMNGLILAGSLAVVSWAQTPVPLDLQGNITISMGGSGSIAFTANGSGTVGNFGIASVAGSGSVPLSVCIPPTYQVNLIGPADSAVGGTAELHYTLTFTAGDTMTGNLLMPCSAFVAALISGSGSGEGSGTVTGGTGRFAGATGEFNPLSMSLTVSNPNVNPIVAPYHLYGSGTLTLPAGQVPVTIATSPAGQPVTVDGVAYTAPQTFQWTAGSQHTVALPTPSTSGTTRQAFSGWSDSGAENPRTIVTPQSAATYTANFVTQHRLTLAVIGNGTAVANPVSADGFYNAGTSVQVVATGTLGAAFGGFFGDVTSNNSPVTFTMSAPRSVTAVFVGGTTPSGARFVAVTPCRIADTRLANGTFGGPVMSGDSTRTFPIPQSACGLTANALAYSLNITVVPRGGLGYLTLSPTGQARPLVSTLNSPSGKIVANAAIVPAGTNGSVDIYVTDLTDVIIDVNGYFAAAANAPAGLAFFPVTPCRVSDTRNAAGGFGGPSMQAGAARSFTVPQSTCGIPATAKAYSLNATVVPKTGGLGYLTLWPTGPAMPVVSTLNSPDGSIVANAAIVPAGTNGAISAFVTDATDLILDINGYFAEPGTGGMYLYTASPCRIADTRNATGMFGGPVMEGGTIRTFPVTLSTCNIPTTAQAFSLNATVVPAGGLGYLTLWPSGKAQPLVSTLNSPRGYIVANAAIVPAGTSGSINAFVTERTELILDINGYFAP